MSKILKVKARQVFDSRGNPTIEAEVHVKNKSAKAICPSGASTGTYEAYEKRDNNNKRYLGKSVFSAINLINSKISRALRNKNVHNQERVDEILINLDGTKQKTKLGANAILAVSMAAKKLSAKVKRGFAPMINSNNQALDLIVLSIKKSGFRNGKDVSICLDVAANELFKKGKYSIHSKKYISVDKTISEYKKLIDKYKIKSIEDPFFENDWTSWSKLMRSTKKVQIVGDDLYVTNLERLKKGFLNVSSNSILIKLNQIGTVTETLDVIRFAQTIGFNTIISHRSGDSEDTFIADLAVGTNSNQIKTGSLARSERVAKYNQLIRIEEELGKKARMNKIH